MKKIAIGVGDIIHINKFGYQHAGVYIGNQGFEPDCVVHNVKGHGVIMSSLADFSEGTEIFIRHKATGNHYDRLTIAQRALSLLGTKYDLLNFNCEHAAYYAHRGMAESPQIAGAAAFAVIVGGLAILSAFSAKEA
jgi:hypothetical protein